MAMTMAHLRRKGWGRKEVKDWMESSRTSPIQLDEDMVRDQAEYKKIDGEIEVLKRSLR